MKPPARTGPRLLLQSHTRHQQSHLSRWHPQSSQRCRNESGEQQSSGIAGGGSSAQVAIAQGTEREQNFLQHRSARDPHSELRTPAPCTRARRIDASHVHLHTHTQHKHKHTRVHNAHTHTALRAPDPRGGRSPTNSGPAEPLSARRSPAGGGTEPPPSPTPLSVRVSPPGTGQRSPPAPRSPDVRGRGCRSGARRRGGWGGLHDECVLWDPWCAMVARRCWRPSCKRQFSCKTGVQVCCGKPSCKGQPSCKGVHRAK